MKKIAILMSALALVGFAACDGNDKDGVDLNTVTEDGFYVVGPAVGIEEIDGKLMMTAGINEVDKQKRVGLYEKYVALEANKDFELLLYKAGNTTRYGANLAEAVLDGSDDQPIVTIQRGELVVGAEASMIQVKEDGLYHIVLDLNEAGDLENAQIIVVPVVWGVRGINNDWGWQEMTRSAFDLNTMSWTIDAFNWNGAKSANIEQNSEFKFSYGGGWKIPLDLAGNVKVETNLGKDMVSGAANITVAKHNGAKITLTWTLANGDIKNSYSYKVEGEKIIVDPQEETVVGFSGGCFAAPNDNWGNPSGETQAICDRTKSVVKDPETMAGTYVYNIESVTFLSTGAFKVRFGGVWFGGKESSLTFEGMDKVGDGDLTPTAGTYSVQFTVEYNGIQVTAIKVVFTEK